MRIAGWKKIYDAGNAVLYFEKVASGSNFSLNNIVTGSVKRI